MINLKLNLIKIFKLIMVELMQLKLIKKWV